MMRLMMTVLGGLMLAAPVVAQTQLQALTPCVTSIHGTTESFFFDDTLPAVAENQSLRERLYGAKGKVSCPGLVTLRAMTPELTDADRGPFCLRWDKEEATYVGFDLGPRDAWMTCRAPSRSFCQRVNGSKETAAKLTDAASEIASETGAEVVRYPGGVAVLRGTGKMLGDKLVELGSVALAAATPGAIAAVAVTAVAVGGAVYLCSDSGAEGAALQAAPAPD